MSRLFEKKRTGEIIKAKRLESGLTQAGFAKKMNVTISAVSKWETGRGMPDISLLYVIAKEFNITIDYLLGGEEQPAADIAIKAYKIRLLKNIIKYVTVFVLAGILITGSVLGVYNNKEAIFYGGSSNRDCYNFAKEYLAAYNGSNEEFAAYLGLSGENIDLLLMTDFIKRKDSHGKLRYLRFFDQENRKQPNGRLEALYSYKDWPATAAIGMGLSAENLFKTEKSWQYIYEFPDITPCGNCYEGIINPETRTISVPVEREGFLQLKDLVFWGIIYNSVVLYDEGNIIGYDIFPKRFIKPFNKNSDPFAGGWFYKNEFFVLLTVNSENLWFKIEEWK